MSLGSAFPVVASISTKFKASSPDNSFPDHLRARVQSRGLRLGSALLTSAVRLNTRELWGCCHEKKKSIEHRERPSAGKITHQPLRARRSTNSITSGEDGSISAAYLPSSKGPSAHEEEDTEANERQEAE